MNGFSDTTKTKAIAAAGNRCAFPGCTSLIFDKDTRTMIGRVAHIKGNKPTSARYDPEQTGVERQSFDNALPVCSPHHDEIDNKENLQEFPVELLVDWKHRHETAHAGRREGAWLRKPHSTTTLSDGEQYTVHWWVDDNKTAQFYTDKQFAQSEAAFQLYVKLTSLQQLLAWIDAATPPEPGKSDGGQFKYLKDKARELGGDPNRFFIDLSELWTMLDDVTFGELDAALTEPRPETADYSRRLQDTRRTGEAVRRKRAREPRIFRWKKN